MLYKYTTAGLLAGASVALASSVNVYFGQNGVDSLWETCQSDGVEYVTLGFVHFSPEKSGGSGLPGTNFGAHCAASVFTGVGGIESKLLSGCNIIAKDITKCQDKGIKVLLSVGGFYSPVTSDYEVTTPATGEEFATFLWNAFGPVNSSWTGPRPFDFEGVPVVLDGFDFDIEHIFPNGQAPYIAMINKLRSHFDASETPSRFLITGAPQCPLAAQFDQMKQMISASRFDHIWVQFYNNPGCSADNAAGFNYDDWETFLSEGASKDAKLYVGLPGSPSAAGSGYITPEAAKNVLCSIKNKPRFGGAMVWDAFFGAQNVDVGGRRYYEALHDILQGGCDSPVSSTTISTTTTSSIASTSTSTSTSTFSTSSISSTTFATSTTTSTYHHFPNGTHTGDLPTPTATLPPTDNDNDGDAEQEYTTSTVYATRTLTITKCPSSVPRCPAHQATPHVTTEVVPIYTTVCPVPPKHGSGGRKPRPGGYNGHDGYGVSGGGDGDVREYGHGKPRPTGELPGGAGKPRPSAGLPGAGSAASVRPKPVTAGAAGMRFGGSVAVVVGAAVAGLALLL